MDKLTVSTPEGTITYTAEGDKLSGVELVEGVLLVLARRGAKSVTIAGYVPGAWVAFSVEYAE